MRHTSAAAIALVATLASSAVAHAHPLVEQGRRQLRRAEFEAALALFDRAAEGDDLTRDDVVDLLDARAMTHLALDDTPALRRDLAGLASLDPEHRFGREAPPELQEAFAQTVQASEGALSLDGRGRGVAGGIEVDVRAVHDAGELVREVRVFVRVGGGSWHRLTDAREPAAEGQVLDFYAEGVGPGGALVATLGDREDPNRSAPALAVGAPPPIRGGGGGGGGLSPWLIVGIGAAGLAVVAAVVIVVVLLTGAGSQAAGTQPESPLVIGF